MVKTRVVEADISDSSSVIAYYLLLSLLPLILMFGSIISTLQYRANLILPYIKNLIPKDIYQLILPSLNKLFKNQPDGYLFVVATIMTIWAVSRGVNGLQRILNRIYGVDQRYNFILMRLFSFGLTFVFFITMGLLAIVISFGNNILEYLQEVFHFDIKFIHLFMTLKWPITIIAMFLIMCLMYFVIPNAKITLKQVVPGALFTTSGWLILAKVFGIFAHHFAHRYYSYGIIGTLIIVVLWLKIAAIIICIGAVINAVITEWQNDGQIIEKVKK